MTPPAELASGLALTGKKSRFAGKRGGVAMSHRSSSEASSKAGARKGSADALKARVDLSLVAEGARSFRAHSKSTIDPPKPPKPTREARTRALKLARRLASSHSG